MFVAMMFALALTQNVKAQDAPAGICQGAWLWAQAKANLTWPYSVFDFAGMPQPDFVDAIETGRLKAGTTDLVLLAMKHGATKPTRIALGGPAATVGVILRKVLTELNDAKLPYLTFMLIGPPELEESTGASIRGLGATFVFVPFEEHRCPKPAATEPKK
jgi:hypothetical protein